MKRPVLAFLRVYKRIVSPLLPNSCRYQPTCSQYMTEAVERYGALKGVWMGLKRLGRCRPGGGTGFDPVP